MDLSPAAYLSTFKFAFFFYYDLANVYVRKLKRNIIDISNRSSTFDRSDHLIFQSQRSSQFGDVSIVSPLGLDSSITAAPRFPLGDWSTYRYHQFCDSPSFSSWADRAYPFHARINQRSGVYRQQLMGKKIKTCLIGDSSVGKTSILLRIIEGSFKEDTPSTIGADYKSQVRKIDGQNVQVELWDTSGQDRYRSVAKNFFRGSDGIFIVFSLADDRSLKGLEYWNTQIKEVLDPSVPKILLGNKADLKKQPSPQAQKLINRLRDEEGYTFYMVSAKSGLNIKESYQTLVNLSYKYMISNGSTSKSIFVPPKAQRQRGGCC